MTLQDAQRLHDLGLNVIPLKAGTKVPDLASWTPYQQGRATTDEIRKWFGNGVQHNVGIPLGVVSGVVVIETDSPEAEAWAQTSLPHTPMQTRSARGIHRYYRLPTGANSRAPIPPTITVGDNIAIEVKRGGQYVVGPGSVHPSGHVYTEVEPWPATLDSVPEFPISVIQAAVGAPSRPDPLPQNVPSGSRNDTLFKEACRLRQLGWDGSEIAKALAALNISRCQPPLDAREVETIAHSAARYEPTADTFPQTEAGDAECFADLYRDQVRHDHRQGRYLVADETSGIWVPDPVEQLTQMAIQMMRVRQRQALALDGDKKKRAMAWSLAGEARKRLTNTLALARSVPPIADVGENWDQNPFLLGAQNGVVDLLTGQFRKATAADRVTMRIRVAFDPTATCPLWLATLNSIFAPNDLLGADESRRIVSFMQRAIGYSITGDCREECCFFTWGAGSNGKGTLMNTLGWLLGDYTDDIPNSTLERPTHGRGIPNDVAKLDGKRFITCAEVNEFTIDEARLKAMTGRDPMTARFLHREWFSFVPVGKIWIATNNKPKIVGTDDGIWRRIHLIPFLQKFEDGGTINKKLKDQLREELPGILNWTVAGTRMWMEEGLNPPATVKAATAAYRNESNPLLPFVEACCVTGTALQMQAALAFKAYEQFCKTTNLEPWRRLSDKAFYKAMQLMFAKVGDRQSFYVGVGLRTLDREPGEEG